MVYCRLQRIRGMATSKGFKRKSRGRLLKPRGSRSGPTPDVYLRSYKPGDRVLIAIEPSVQKGSPHRRYHGRVGEVVEKRGRGYVVHVRLGNKVKKLCLLPDHVRGGAG
ncbi:MAG: 50S ribosomal protein L21e [Candidatus Caldarchaeum sp.]